MHPLAQFTVTQGVLLGALALVIGWLLLRTHRYLARQKGSDAPLVRVDRPKQAKHAHHLDAPPEVARWEVQMHETARELSAQFEHTVGVTETGCEVFTLSPAGLNKPPYRIP